MSSTLPRRTFLLGLAAAAALPTAACSGKTASFSGGSGSSGKKSDAKSVSVAVVAGWDDAIAVTYLWKEILEQRGYTVNLQELDIASTFTGVANGQIDLYLDAWLPVTHEAYWKRYQDKLEVLSSWSTGDNVLAVPNYAPVNSLAELKGRSADFGGRIVGIEAGGGLMRATRDSVMKAYGLSDYTLVEGSTPAMLAALDVAVKAQQNIVVTLWRPHWAFSRYPIRALTDPQGAFGKPDSLQAIATKGFSESKAEVAGWLKNFKLTPEQLPDIMLKINEAGKGKEQEAVKAWVAANQQSVDAWLGAATG